MSLTAPFTPGEILSLVERRTVFQAVYLVKTKRKIQESSQKQNKKITQSSSPKKEKSTKEINKRSRDLKLEKSSDPVGTRTKLP